jgi:hypothetical protein
MSELTKKAALDAGSVFDQAADRATKLAAEGHIHPQIAEKFAFQCDLLSDHLAKKAGFSDPREASLAKEALTGDDVHNEGAHGEDPEQIGEEKGGPHEGDADESYMSDQFSQQENRELREKVETGEVSNSGISPDEQSPRPGIQASLENGQKLSTLMVNIQKAASKCASHQNPDVKALGTKLANTGLEVLQFQARLMQGSETDARVAGLLRNAGHVLPHFDNDIPPAWVPKFARMVDLLAKAASV